MLFCCSQNKNNIRRRFFECFQQSIECSGRKHMNLIDNIYFITSLNRGILYLFPDIPDILHTVIRSRIDFEYIKRTLCVNCLTGRTGITGISIDRMLTVYRRLAEKDFLFLYLLFLYPEKFWKISNQYYNHRKSWIPPKTLEKLQKVLAQNEERHTFLKQFASFLNTLDKNFL